jgi:hypothetical protein
MTNLFSLNMDAIAGRSLEGARSVGAVKSRYGVLRRSLSKKGLSLTFSQIT